MFFELKDSFVFIIKYSAFLVYGVDKNSGNFRLKNLYYESKYSKFDFQTRESSKSKYLDFQVFRADKKFDLYI